MHASIGGSSYRYCNDIRVGKHKAKSNIYLSLISDHLRWPCLIFWSDDGMRHMTNVHENIKALISNSTNVEYKKLIPRI